MKKQFLTIGLVLLFIFSSIIPISIGSDVKIPNNLMQSYYRGITLYVGGTGPNNYTKIQDAINDSIDGDTVFVYDDSSPYYELLLVDKSISLIGENRNSTIIDGNGSYNIINIISEEVTINSFTIQNSDDFDSPIINITSNSTIIKYNIIRASRGFGIKLSSVNNILISENAIYQVRIGIEIIDSNDIRITNNNIYSNNEDGIRSDIANDLLILGNTFLQTFALSENIDLVDSESAIIKRNTFKSSSIGISLSICRNCIVSENNCMNDEFFIGFVYTYPPGPKKCNNIFDKNYWSKPRFLPKPIIGFICIFPDILGFFPLPWVQFDWHPAKEPYDISV